MSHNHGHDHGHHGCDHGQAGKTGEELGVQYSLYQKIDLENVSCLNEEVEGSGKLVFKPWEDRKNREKVRHSFGVINVLICGHFAVIFAIILTFCVFTFLVFCSFFIPKIVQK